MLTVGVTGTNGKTSTCSFIHQLLMGLELRVASATSMGLTGPADLELDLPPTAPVPESIAALDDADIDVLVLETVSRALVDGRLGDHVYDAVVVLDVTGDHLDEHGGFAAYAAAKRRILQRLPTGGPAVISTRYDTSDPMLAEAERRDLDVVRIGPGEDWSVGLPDADGRRRLVLDGEEYLLDLRLPSGFLEENLVAALAGCHALLGRLPELIDLAPSVVPPPGRMEVVAQHNGAKVLVDNSHNPGGLAAALADARALAAEDARLWVVFGCGGERDHSKRPLMGRIAAERADVVIVTDDNPRSEDPAAIRAAVLSGCRGAVEVPDRREAVWTAMERLAPGDVLLVAGRGAEQETEVDGATRPLSDAAIIRAGLSAQRTG